MKRYNRHIRRALLALGLFAMIPTWASAASLVVSAEKIMKTNSMKGDLYLAFNESSVVQGLIAYDFNGNIITIYSCETLSTSFDNQFTLPVRHNKIVQSVSANIPNTTCGGNLKSVSFSGMELCDTINSICVSVPDLSVNF